MEESILQDLQTGKISKPDLGSTIGNNIFNHTTYSWLFSTSVTTADDHKALFQTLKIISLNVNHSTLLALLALIEGLKKLQAMNSSN